MALYAQRNADGKLELINHLGIEKFSLIFKKENTSKRTSIPLAKKDTITTIVTTYAKSMLILLPASMPTLLAYMKPQVAQVV